MKKYIFTAFILVISFVVSAQTLYTSKADSIPAKGSSFTLQINSYRGNIQWQSSTDSKTWIDLSGETNSQLVISSSTEAFYRAKITDGDCFVTYTDSAVVLSMKAQNITFDPKAIEDATLSSSDSNRFVYRTTGTLPIEEGDIMLAPDSTDKIHIVSGIENSGDSIIVHTTDGTMEDLFLNQLLNLSTESASSVRSTQGLTRSMTVKDGYIHPTEVIDYNSNSKKTLTESLKSANANLNVPLVNFEENFSGEIIYSSDNLLLQFKEAYFNFNSVLKCEFQFAQLKFDWAHLKISGGNLQRFSFYTDPDATSVDAKLVLLAQAKGNVSVDKEWTIKKNVLNKSFKFMIGDVPVWMDVAMDLMGKVSGEVSSELTVTGGTTASASAKLGATYKNNSWSRINESTASFTLEGPDVDGKVNQNIQVEVYPHIEVKFYKVIGPKLDIAPYLREKMNFRTSGNYDFGLYGGANARLGIDMTAFGKTLFDLKTEDIKLVEKELYKVPKKLKLVSGNNQIGAAGDTLPNPIVLQALDSKGNSVPTCNINLQCTTSCTDTVISTETTDSDGLLNYSWKLNDNASGEQTLEVYIKDGQDKKIVTADTTVQANTNTFTDPRDGHVYKINIIGSQTWMAENLKTTMYNDGTPIPNVTDNNEWAYLTTGAYSSQEKASGFYYNWYAVNSGKLAPKGWHVATSSDYTNLYKYLTANGFSYKNSTSYDVAKALAASNGWNECRLYGAIGFQSELNNGSGFNALPDGYRARNGKYFDFGDYGYWWTSTKYDYKSSYTFLLSSCSIGVMTGTSEYQVGHSIRCVKD